MKNNQVEDFLILKKEPGFRIKQFNKAMYQDLISSFSELTTWPINLRKEFAKNVLFSEILPVTNLVSIDKKTEKVVFRRVLDNLVFESVLMRHLEGRNTVCVSCMVGCPMNCSFCATGKLGFKASLSSSEIVDQVLFFARKLNKEKEKVTNIVFMGMGEPLLNLSEVLKAIKVFTSNQKMAMSIRRITISTSGITPSLKDLFASGYKGRLALSLHAPNQEIREKIMPKTKKYPLAELLNTIKKFSGATNKRVSYEYILIEGLNDQEKHARELVALLGIKLTHVNLIPLNPVAGFPFKRPSRNSIFRFAKILEDLGMQYTLRTTLGDDIKAACGQLAGKEA